MVYAVGDIHGYIDQLDRALALIEADGGRDAPVIFLGDYVDRGPDSRAVIDRLIQGQEAGRPWTYLLGNHDRFFRRFLENGALTDSVLRPGITWLHPNMGGRETLVSYLGDRAVPPSTALPGEDACPSDMVRAVSEAARAAVPEDHQTFLERLVPLHETAEQVFVHAGIRPGIPLEDQAEDDLIWIRKPFLDDPRDHGRLIVHGHTALPAARHYGNRLNLDSGAGYGDPITVAYIQGRDAWALAEDGRLPLRPDAGQTGPSKPI
ncbi:MAG: metallophosphoesterase family protein [Pseudomonadota bacterium]